jgi:arsenate reductase (thioredoxin)
MAIPYNILYLSNRNTTRSIFAEAVANGKGRGRFKGYSAGLNPASELDPLALNILRLSDYPTEGLRPKHWREFAGEDAPAFDFVFTLCDLDAGEPPPHWPGRPVTADWRYPDPEKLGGEDWAKRKALSEILAGLERQFEAFAQLPFESLDEMSLRTQLDKLHQAPA